MREYWKEGSKILTRAYWILTQTHDILIGIRSLISKHEYRQNYCLRIGWHRMQKRDQSKIGQICSFRVLWNTNWATTRRLDVKNERNVSSTPSMSSLRPSLLSRRHQQHRYYYQKCCVNAQKYSNSNSLGECRGHKQRQFSSPFIISYQISTNIKVCLLHKLLSTIETDIIQR